MKRIAKPSTDIAAMLKPKDKPEEAVHVSDVSIQRLIDDSLQILYRETKNLLRISVNGKLDAANARDLRDNLKVLFELKEREADMLKGLSDEQIDELYNKPKEEKPE